jgi:transposase
MARKLRARQLTDEEGERLLRIVRRGHRYKATTWRRAMIIMASASGHEVRVIANLVQTSPDWVREVIHAFNTQGLRCLDPKWAGGRPRRIGKRDRELIVRVARKRPRSLGQPFTRWSLRKLRDYLVTKKGRKVEVSRERLRQILAEEGITFQRTKTWKESPDPHKEEKLRRIEEVVERHADRTFAFDEFGPLSLQPYGGQAWAEKGKPQRVRANYRRLSGTRVFYGCYSVSEDRIWGKVRPRKSRRHFVAALASIRAERPDGQPIFVICDNLSAHKGPKVREWCEKNKVELCYTPTYSSWANPIEPHFGALRSFVLRNSDYPSHRQLAAALHAYLRWRNANARDPRILELVRKERARLRGEAQRRWGHPRARAA